MRGLLHEDDFTLVELMVSSTIMATGIDAVVTAFHSPTSVAVQSNRSRALASPTRETETMRPVPYGRRGFAVELFAEPLVGPHGPDRSLGRTTFSFSGPESDPTIDSGVQWHESSMIDSAEVDGVAPNCALGFDPNLRAELAQAWRVSHRHEFLSNEVPI